MTSLSDIINVSPNSWYVNYLGTLLKKSSLKSLKKSCSRILLNLESTPVSIVLLSNTLYTLVLLQHSFFESHDTEHPFSFSTSLIRRPICIFPWYKKCGCICLSFLRLWKTLAWNIQYIHTRIVYITLIHKQSGVGAHITSPCSRNFQISERDEVITLLQ